MQSETSSHPARFYILSALMTSELFTLDQAERLADAILDTLEANDIQILKRPRFAPWQEGFTNVKEPGV